MSTSKIALVTGANKGIGLETVRQLAEQGMTVFLAARDAAKGEAAVAKLRQDGLEVRALALEVTNSASVAEAAKAVQDEFGRLDILVNNAGVMLDDTSKKTSEQPLEVWRSTFDTNLFGVIEVTRAFLPLLRQSEAGRIVNLSSILGSLTMHADPVSPIYGYKIAAYDVSKTALNGWTVHLAHELRETAIKVNSAHPGHVKTDMGGEEAPMELSQGAKTSVALATLPPEGPSGTFVHLGEELPW